MGEKRLVTELVTMLVIDGKKGESQGRIKDIRKPAILCGLRVSLVEVTGFEPATFWSRRVQKTLQPLNTHKNGLFRMCLSPMM